MAHTEYSRLLSEHGFFGAIALCALGAMCFVQWRQGESPRDRALRIAFLLWSLASMTHVGMRIAAIGLVFGLGCTKTLLAENPAPPDAAV